MRLAILVAIATLLSACGARPPQLGVLVAIEPYQVEAAGPAQADAGGREFAGASSLLRAEKADILPNDGIESVVELPSGRGLEIHDAAGAPVTQVLTSAYLTDFGILEATKTDAARLVVYLYPDDARSATFQVLGADGTRLHEWIENPPPGRFAVGRWHGAEAVFYLQHETLIVRAIGGELLQRLPVPGGRRFGRVFVGPVADDRLVVVASGDGYTPYHMVCVYDAAGELLYQRVADEHAFSVESSGESASFVVETRLTRWQYAPDGSVARSER